MIPQQPEDGFVRMSEHAFEAILARAAEEGAKRAFAKLGIDNGHAAADIRDLRALIAAIRAARRTFWNTVVRITTTGLILGLIAGLALEIRLFKGD